MKKKLTVLMLAFTMVFTMLAATACGGQSEEKAEKTYYGEGYVFKQGFDLDYRPYSFVDDNGENGGCSSAVGFAIIPMTLTLALASATVCKKRRK